MNRFGWLLNVVRNPAETITWVISAGLLFFALYFSSPFYEGEYVTPLTISFTDRGEGYFVSAVFGLLSLPGFIAPFMGSRKQSFFKAGSFIGFLLFFFLFVLRVASIGWIPISWLPLLMLALISGILRLYFGVKQR